MPNERRFLQRMLDNEALDVFRKRSVIVSWVLRRVTMISEVLTLALAQIQRWKRPWFYTMAYTGRFNSRAKTLYGRADQRQSIDNLYDTLTY